ncbi:dihydrofolate reductase [Bacillus phage BCPST]|uniref:dihydrofolate reductase n=1 Tax=Bacillus phage BCPST TaxID=2801506 RepID=A0AAE7P6Z9_9CAUD|nr:dihydrofolate reductase [Bacillus phage BCPST]QQO38680.1 dihydrofolate reductase [Bacillus phage BCPST]QSJ04272.1 dihydrofolate reductase [Bacillus phage BCP6]WEM05687.1 dihydrofolate reductase [Bacillus phage BSG01]
MIKMILACDLNGVIGNNGSLPWGRSLPYDLKRFKELTEGHIVVMGRKTFESLGSKPLPNRENVVLTSNPAAYKNGKYLYHVDSVERVFNEYDLVSGNQDLWIIGGMNVYKQFMPYVQELYVTVVGSQFEGDTQIDDDFRDELANNFTYELLEEKNKDESNMYNMIFVKYVRVKGEYK